MDDRAVLPAVRVRGVALRDGLAAPVRDCARHIGAGPRRYSCVVHGWVGVRVVVGIEMG